MLPWCFGLSAAVHVLLLASVASSAPRAAGLMHAARRSTGPVSVQLITAGAGTPNEAAEIVSSSQASDPRTTLPAAPVPASAPIPASTPAPASGPALAALPTQSESSANDVRPLADDSADGGYMPRPLLTVAPRPEAPVVIAMPSGAGEVGRRVGVLVLFIDEQGRVRHIEAEPPMLPPAMDRAAREAFGAARFAPGQVDGQVVKSRILVEVAFDGGSLPAASGASAPRPASGTSTASPASAASTARAASDQRSR